MDKQTLINYFSGNATPEEEACIMDWAEASPDNYRQYLNERKLWDALTLNTLTPASKTVNRPLLIWKIAGVAASLALILLFSWQQFQSRGGFPADETQTIIVPPGQRVHLILQDSTSIWLNSNTTLSYPSLFSRMKREVLLDGEAFFEVSHQKGVPFIVKTHQYDIEVTGTTFNVYAYNKRHEPFETSLLSGSINITKTDDSNQRIYLTPNERVTETDGILTKSEINDPDHFRWKDGLICMDDMPFDILMKKFSAYYDIDIQIENVNVNNYRCTGKFRQSDGIDYALRVIQKDLNFTFERMNTENHDKIIIR